jgi:predicted ester cyclase
MRNFSDTVQYKWFNEVWNQANENAIDKFLTTDVMAHGLTDERGPEGFKTFYRNFTSQFSEINIEVEDVIVQGDMEVSRCNVRATETASGKPVQFTGTCMAHIKDGKIAEAWNHYDFMTMYQQLGHKLTPPSI